MAIYKCTTCGKIYDSPIKVCAVSHICPQVAPGKPRVRKMVAV